MNIETVFNSAALKRFHCPGTLVWGTESRWRVADLLAGVPAVGIFVDSHFERHEFVEHVRASLGSRLLFTEVCASTPNTQHLEALARLPRPVAILSVGGGSTIDAAKAVIAQWLYGTLDGVGMGARRGEAPMAGVRRPLLIAVPTTAGTGADTSRYYVTYNSETGAKVHGKSWKLVADWTILDSAFIRDAPADLLVKSAFDAFIHSFETLICRQEQSWFGDMLSLECMTRILLSLDRIVHQGARDDDTLLELLYAASVAGLAISNIRTGSIHEAAGALLERSSLTHPETLMVFFRPAYRQYRDAIADREALLLRRLACEAPGLGFVDFSAIVQWWEEAFAAVGLTARISAAMATVTAPQELKEHLVRRVRADRVWCTKESPVLLDEAMIRGFIDDALAPYGYAVTG